MVVESKLKEELMRETILNTLSELVLYQDKENRILWANRASGDSVGLAPEELVGRCCYEVWHQRSEPCEGCPVVEARETGESHIAEITSPDGRVWLIRGYPVRSENGEILGVIEITLDITERKRAEEMRQRAQDELEIRLQEHNTELAVINEELRKANRALTALSECSQTLVRTTDESKLLREVCRIIVETGGYHLAWVGLAEQNEEKTVRPVTQCGYEEGYLETLHITWSDTERGRGPTGTAVRTGEPCICRDILTDPNFSPWREEATRRGYASSIALPLLTNCQVLGTLNIYAIEPDAFDAEEVKLLTELADDLAYGIVALRTRAERQQAEDALRESENKFRDLAEKSFVGIYLIQDGVFKYVNPRLAEIFGYEVEEITEKKNVRDLTFPEDWPTVEENIRKRITGEVDSVHYVFRGIARNQDTIWVETYGSKTIYQGRPAVIGTLLDITERKLVEQALHLSEEKFRTIVEQSHDMIWTIDVDSNLSFFNKRCEEISGYQLAEYQGETFISLVVEEYLPWVIEANRRALNGEPQHYELGIRKKDGDVLIVSVNTAPIFMGHEVVGTVSFGRNITEQKQAEERLKMEAQLLDAATDSIIVYDFEGNCIFANEAAYKSRGFSKDELMRLNLRDSLTPEYANLIEPWMKKLTETGEATLECAVFCKNRSTMPIEVHARIIESGGRKLILGVARDITKRKQAEQELRTSLEKLSGSI